MITFSCVGCGANLHIGDEWAGKQGRCPHCQTLTWLPAPVSSGRTSKLGVLFRFLFIPIIVMASYCVFLPDWWEGFLYATIFLIVVVFLMWAFVNLYVFIGCPREYRMWKAGGGDPFIDTLPEPFNNDPAEVRYRGGAGSKLARRTHSCWTIFPAAVCGISKDSEGVWQPVELGEGPAWDLECSSSWFFSYHLHLGSRRGGFAKSTRTGRNDGGRPGPSQASSTTV